MGLGRGALLWLIGIPVPIIILLALFWRYPDKTVRNDPGSSPGSSLWADQ